MPETTKKTARKATKKKTAAKSGYDAGSAPTPVMCKTFGLAPRTARQIATDGCPRNANGTWNLPEVHRWLMDRAEANLRKKFGYEHSKGSIQRDKIATDIEWKRLQIAKQREELIEREEHEMILGARISALRHHIEDAFFRNSHRFVGLSLADTQSLCREFGKQFMNAYLNGSMGIERDRAEIAGGEGAGDE